MEMQTVFGVGIVGYGGFGKFLRQSWETMSEVRVTAVSDEDPARRPESDGRKVPAFYQNYDDMLADRNVQIVCIATPPSLHKEMALKAIAAGKHTLVEKPFATSASEGGEIATAASAAGVVATVNFMLRYDPLVTLIRQIIDAGVFGRLRRIDLRNYAQQEGVPEGHWFWDRAQSGGILIEHGVHFFDLAAYLNRSAPSFVTGLAVERKPGMEDRVFAAVSYENGVVGTFWHSFSLPQPLERTGMHFAFDLGEINMGGWIPLEADFWGWTHDEGVRILQSAACTAELEIERLERRPARSSDQEYEVTASVRGRYALPKPKLEVYAECLRDIMRDLVKAAKDPSHQLLVTARDGITAVKLAEMATTAIRERRCVTSGQMRSEV